MKNIFIIGSKGIPAKYGGFETFVENLTKYRKDPDLRYHVACLSDSEGEFEYNNARCFKVRVPNIGPAKAVYYDIQALKAVLAYIDRQQIEEGIVYVLACRIGPFFKRYVKKFHRRNIQVFVNPDGHEFKRAKWNYFIKKYWRYSEGLMVKSADLLICDSKNIEKYIQKEYTEYRPRTTFIAYGADIVEQVDSDKFNTWARQFALKKDNYYLIVGRFVPENNYETMIREFMLSKTEKDLVIITDYQGSKLYSLLQDKLNFKLDKRIKFVGTAYDPILLRTIRSYAYGYLHGHEVGGTNPSLLEALGSTKLNLLLDVGFNQEVGLDSCLYWSKEKESLAQVINLADRLTAAQIEARGHKAKARVIEDYSWDIIIDRYENLFKS